MWELKNQQLIQVSKNNSQKIINVKIWYVIQNLKKIKLSELNKYLNFPKNDHFPQNCQNWEGHKLTSKFKFGMKFHNHIRESR